MSAVSTGIGNAMGTGGKSMGGGQMPQGPQMGFGFNPNTDMPFTGGQNAGNGGDSIIDNSQGQMMPGPTMGMAGGTIQGTPPAGGFVNPFSSGGKGGFAEAPMAFGTSMGGSAGPGVNGINPFTGQAIGGGKGLGQDLGSILGSVGGLGSQMLTQINPGLAPIGNVVNTAGQGAGAILNGALNGIQGNVFGGGNSIYQPNFMPQGPQIGFGPAPIEQNPMQPAPQPVNRFAPPNAPGVRQQPRTAPRAGIPVQSARMVQPNRNTRTRLR